ncbi:MAG TPA: penicillin-binding protein 2 [Gammaproteobacteria bacterium]|nr:penicillin-binding protein 2 [Gammaproteobacteria bacterium]
MNVSRKKIRAQPIIQQRRILLLVILGVFAVALMGRAAYLQILNKEFYQGKAKNHSSTVIIASHRGMITDRFGEPLAVSTPVYSVWMNPQKLDADSRQLPHLAHILDIKVSRIHQLLKKYENSSFVYLKRQIEPSQAEWAKKIGLDGVYIQREYRRYYPSADVMAHVTGFTNIEDHGLEGLEKTYDAFLSGTNGKERVLRDSRRRAIEKIDRMQEPVPGKDLKLSIDRRLQYLAYRELKIAIDKHKALSGSVVMLDVKSGEVLAMVNSPSYNPNDWSSRKGSSLRNRAVTDIFEPGSTIKPFVVAAALDTGRYSPETEINTAPGYFRVNAHLTVRDIKNYGLIDVSTIISKSSNIGMSKIALSLESDLLWQTFSDVGLGMITGSGFPGEADGRLSYPGRWHEAERATLSFGYGLSLTPLQLARAYSVLADDGLIKPVSFTVIDETPVSERVFQAETAARLRTMMEKVVADGGTATRAQIPGYRIAGKTGTVKKSSRSGYSEDKYLSIFAGMAPASDPQLVMVVVVDEPRENGYYGGVVAAPVFSKVMSGALRLMDIPPDHLESLDAHMVLGSEAPESSLAGML